MERWIKPLAVLTTLNLVVALGTVVRRSGAEARKHVSASFTRTVGLYPGSSVRVLGVSIGTVTKITPQGRTVRVEMSVDPEVEIPAEAGAVIIPPSLVSDRYVQLVPAYTGGPVMPDGTHIPVSRTRTPVELDEVTASLDRFLVALGPGGANAKGSLADLVDVGARALGGENGGKLNQALRDLAGALGVLAEGRDDFGGLITNLSEFTELLATNDAKVRRLTADLATVSEQLAGEREALEQALANLAVALGEIGSLVRDHRENLGEDIDALADVTRTVLRHRDSLVEFLDTSPLVAANLVDATNTERDTLDIRNNNDQTSNPYDIIVCQVLAPILDISCPPDPTAPVPSGARGRAAPRPASAPRPPAFERFTIAGLLGGGAG